ncbi:MAG: MgtC/SapB family protein [Lachnospiraceae bacterium]|nr:MgtC/SapB family protein [Lachnospiraceae bacterium]
MGEMQIWSQFQTPGIWLQLEYLLRIVIAAALGMIIGSERKNRNKSAGVRTHAIVALGAALMMVVSKYGFEDVAKGDAARLAAQVVSGVGFLGAGVIFVRNNLVNGLTTAAGMWTTAGVGLAMGAGMYVIGISSAVLIIITQFIMHKISYFANVASGGLIHMTIVKKSGAVEAMEEFLTKQHVEILGVKINKNKKEEIKLEFDVVYPPGFNKSALLAKIVEMDEVLQVTE